jgi:hypothetical protein
MTYAKDSMSQFYLATGSKETALIPRCKRDNITNSKIDLEEDGREDVVWNHVS